MQYQLREIEESDLKNGEEEELEAKRNVMLNSEKISKNLMEADQALNENAMEALSIAIRSLEKIEEFDSKYKQNLSQLKSTYYDIQELGRDIASQKEENLFDESNRVEIEERLDTIYSLKRN